jgi:hypothetical protein
MSKPAWSHSAGSSLTTPMPPITSKTSISFIGPPSNSWRACSPSLPAINEASLGDEAHHWETKQSFPPRWPVELASNVDEDRRPLGRGVAGGQAPNHVEAARAEVGGLQAQRGRQLAGRDGGQGQAKGGRAERVGGAGVAASEAQSGSVSLFLDLENVDGRSSNTLG